MKNIAIYLGNEPYPKQGGMERATDLLIKMLSAHYNIIIICKEKNRLGEIYISPAPIYFLPSDSEKQRANLIDLLRSNQIHVLIDQCEGGVVGRYGIFRKRSDLLVDGIKLVAVQHSSPMAALNNYCVLKRKQFKYLYMNILYNVLLLYFLKQRAYWLQKSLATDLNKNYDKIVTLSPAFITHFYKLCSQKSKGKVVAIPNPNTYEESVERTVAEKSVLFVGRLDNRTKGVDRLLRIWSMVESRCSDWGLQIVGDGQDKQMLENLKEELQLKRVSFEGFRSPKSYYETASILCMTSTFEGFGMVLTEAMQHGVVPMAFNSYDALQDIITPEKDGVVITAFDEKSYADRLLALIEDQHTLRKMAVQAMLSSTRFSRSNIIDKWCDLIDNL